MVALEAVIAATTDHLMTLPNVVGVGRGQRAGRPVIVVLVVQKVDRASLAPGEVVPHELHGYETDVVEIGVPEALE